MSAPSQTQNTVDHIADARDAYFSGVMQPADEFPTAEHEPPVCPVSTPPREVTRDELHNQTLRLEILLSLWRLEFGSLVGFWEAHPESRPTSATAASFTDLHVSPPAEHPPDPVTDQDYIAQVALELFGNHAA